MSDPAWPGRVTVEGSAISHGPALTLVRHGQTEWSENGRHTSRTDLELLPLGRERAAGLSRLLNPGAFDLALCSPRRRAAQTAELAGFGSVAMTEDLAEWDYGDFEGLTAAEIRARAPRWDLWHDGCPGGESPAQVAVRAERVIARALAHGGEVILFAHGHILRALSACWLGGPIDLGRHLVLAPATVSRLAVLADTRVLERWNLP